MSTSIGRMPALSTRILDVGFDADQVWFTPEDVVRLACPASGFLASTSERGGAGDWELIPGGDAVH